MRTMVLEYLPTLALKFTQMANMLYMEHMGMSGCRAGPKPNMSTKTLRTRSDSRDFPAKHDTPNSRLHTEARGIGTTLQLAS